MIVKIIVLALFVAFTEGCASEFNSGPCSCELNERNQVRITCKGIDNEYDLVRGVQPTVGLHVFSLTIVDAVLSYLPHDAFAGMKFTMLEIFNSSLIALSDTDVAFEGLENHLRSLAIENCSFMCSWDWYNLRNLKKLSTLSVRKCELESIEGMKHINLQELTYIALTEHRINFIDDKAFEDSTCLRTLRLNNNEISEMKRSMLPNPAGYLSEINLSYNKIERLPGDMFTNMPQLAFLDISYNSILYLDEQVFIPVWSKLTEFNALGTDIVCDCRMTWMLRIKHPEDVHAFCDQPPNLNEINVANLTSQQLWCFV